MAVVISPKQQSFSFPHNILHRPTAYSLASSMEHSINIKPSLPSISSLISDIDKFEENRQDRSPGSDHQRRTSGGSLHQPTSPDRPPIINSPANHTKLPPTPPLPGTSSFDFPPRPSTGNLSPSATNGTQHNHYFAASPNSSSNPENYAQRSSYPPIPDSNQWPPQHSPVASQPRNQDEPTSRESHRGSQSSYPDLSDSSTGYTGLQQQRPLPGNFPPSVPASGQTLPPIDPQMAPPYQHHHHTYPVSNPPAYSQNTDRYICPTCQKAFSRPSSLKIHTYSHTGEKPFKCKYEGCGKYFSVRSNMKRHEKGCHGGDTSSAGNSPKP